ncbi:YacL family protein [Thaumasiovibrio subtropicus]|uniref:YacL family protein n=1 Tax=Thaumasiovibrio subtropicus TaxID=1891207 RepID=UPI000B34F605|nr:YacL family protein [Thaumasiovibrio subtropicus]
MEYEFKKNTLDGSYNASFSMGHEVLGRWLTDELGTQAPVITAMSEALQSVGVTEQEWRHLGKHYTVIMQSGEVTVVANMLLQGETELDELHQQQDLGFYDDEQIALCGLEDLLRMLDDWCAFVRSR